MLIVAVIVVFVVAFVVTMLVLNVQGKKMVSTNTKLVENQNTLLEQNEQRESELVKRIDDLEEQLKQHIEVTLLQEQTRPHRERIELTADMSDEELMTWMDYEMDERLLYTDSELTLKTMAQTLGLTQKRLGELFKNNEKYNSLGDYLNEKRFLYACRLLREKPEIILRAPMVHIASFLQMTPETLSRVRNGSLQTAAKQPHSPKDQNDAWWTHATK